MTVPAIDVRGLVKRYGNRTVVDQVDLRIMPGRICGFLGPNGSGKTTTLRMICGLLTPDGGEGRCLGHDIITERDAIKAQAGYMTQRFGLYEDLTIRQNLEFVGRLYRLRNLRDVVDAALERLGLATRQHQLTGGLSGGWKQRLALAACVLHQPKLLLLDEPTAGVDPKARRDFWNEIHRFSAQGLTFLVATHYMDEAERCHEIAYIAYGRLLVHGTVGEVIDHSGLTTYTVSGRGVPRLSDELSDKAGVMVTPFGAKLHVSARDEAALTAAIEPYRQDRELEWEVSSPSLEDVFIDLMTQARDNFQ